MLLTENRLSKTKEKYGDFIEKNEKLYHSLISNPFMIDSNYKYLDWLLSIFSREFVDLKLSDIIDVLAKFHKVYRNLERPDIYSYTKWHQLQSAVVNYITRRDQHEAITKQTDILFSNNQYLILRPLSEEASQKYGANTKWCTAAMEGCRFNGYFHSDYLIYVIDKINNTKVAIVFGKSNSSTLKIENRITCYDSQDQTFPFERLPDLVKKHILDYYSTKVNEVTFLTIEEFKEKYVAEIVEKYPTTLKCKFLHSAFEIKAGYQEGGEHGVFLTYDIEFFNVHIKVTTDFNHQLLINVHDNDKRRDENSFLTATNYGLRVDNYNFLMTDCNDSYLQIIEKTFIEFITHNEQFLRTYNADSNIVYWTPKSSFSGRSLEGRKPTPAIDKFLTYVEEQNKKNVPATRRDYIENVLNKKGVEIRGYQSMMFADLINAKIVERVKLDKGYTYKIGPNYQAFKEGRLLSTKGSH